MVQDGGIALSSMEGKLSARLTLPQPVHTASAPLAVTRDGGWLATALTHSADAYTCQSALSRIYIWGLQHKAVSHALQLSPGSAVVQIDFVPGSTMLAVLTADSRLTTLDAISGTVASCIHSSGAAEAFALEAHGNYAAIISSTGTLALYDLAAARAAFSQANSSPGQEQVVSRIEHYELCTHVTASDGAATQAVDAENLQHNATDAVAAASSAAHKSQSGPRCKVTAELPLAQPGVSGPKFDVQRMKKLLNANGQYPHQHRLMVWEGLLALPRNREAHALLAEKGRHPAAEALTEQCAPRDAFAAHLRMLVAARDCKSSTVATPTKL